MDTQLGARPRRRAVRLHRGSGQRTIAVRPTVVSRLRANGRGLRDRRSRRTGGSGDPARTSAISPRGKKTCVNRNFAACQCGPGDCVPHAAPFSPETLFSPLAFAQLALGLRLADPGNGGSKAVVSWEEGTNLLAVWRTCSELSVRAISASRRLTETVCEVWAARARTASILTVSSVSCESWSSQTTGSMSVRFLIRLITEHRCAGLGLTSRPPRLISSWFRPRALRTVVAVSRMVESES